MEVLDLAHDYYGARLAMSSSDQMIRVYNEQGCKTAEWKAHLGSIWRVVWAHPEFGSVIGSCSFDRKVCIWEELADAEEVGTQPKGGWRLQAELQEARDTVHDIKFAPKHLGLRLASASADKLVRVYEAADIMDLSSWELTHQFEPDGAKHAPQCVAWCPSAASPMTLAVGMADGAVLIWRFSDKTNAWQNALALEAVELSRQRMAHLDCVHDVSWAADVGRRRVNSALVWRVEWNVCGSLLAASVDEGRVHVYKLDAKGEWSRAWSTHPK